MEQTYWKAIQSGCEFYWSVMGGKKDDLPPSSPHVVEVFDASQVTKNVGRFVTYIIWLKQQPDSFESFCRLLKERKAIIDRCNTKLNFKLITTYNLPFIKYR